MVNNISHKVLDKSEDFLERTRTRVKIAKKATDDIIKEIRSNYRLSELILKISVGNR